MRTLLPSRTMWKAEPSSPVKTATSMGLSFWKPSSSILLTASRVAITPRAPSNIPPFSTESRWEPAMTAPLEVLKPSLLPKMLPTGSMRNFSPASFILPMR